MELPAVIFLGYADNFCDNQVILIYKLFLLIILKENVEKHSSALCAEVIYFIKYANMQIKYVYMQIVISICIISKLTCKKFEINVSNHKYEILTYRHDDMRKKIL